MNLAIWLSGGLVSQRLDSVILKVSSNLDDSVCDSVGFSVSPGMEVPDLLRQLVQYLTAIMVNAFS